MRYQFDERARNVGMNTAAAVIQNAFRRRSSLAKFNTALRAAQRQQRIQKQYKATPTLGAMPDLVVANIRSFLK